MPGAQEGAIPPRLQQQNGGNTWDNWSAFGPVPASRAALGAETCAQLNTMAQKFKAIGYHSRAQGLDGKPLPNGGFYCAPQ